MPFENPLLSSLQLYISKHESISPEEGTQLIFASSTFPQDANDILAEMFEDKEDVTKIKSPYLHRVLCHVKQKFWRVDGDTRTGKYILFKLSFDTFCSIKLDAILLHYILLCLISYNDII